MKPGIRELVFLVLLLCIPIGAWLLVFRPQNARNAELMTQIEARQQKLRDLNLATASIGDLKKEISALEQAMSFFQSKLPNEKEIDKVLKEVWQTATANQLVTKSIRTVNSDKTDSAALAAGPHEQPILMQLEGDYTGFYSFLQALENQPRIMQVRNMKLEKLRNGPEGHMAAKFEMCIFFETGDRG